MIALDPETSNLPGKPACEAPRAPLGVARRREIAREPAA
jgi:hypothetical protein